MRLCSRLTGMFSDRVLVQGLASVVQALAVVLTGTVGLIGLLFTWRNLSQTRKSTQRSLELTEQGQITERFTRAIDQLGETADNGDPRLEIRLGGIYALERIDKESPERAYHSTVMEVLTAYVRENAPRPTKASNKSPEGDFIKPPQGDPASSSGPDEAAEQEEGTKQGVEPTSAPPRTDIQAILRVLNRREEDRVPKNHRVQSLDLRGTNLQEAWLWEADLSEAMLGDSVLQGANLFDADLSEANLPGADLTKANLSGADLSGADLSISFRGPVHAPDLIRASLQEADLRKTNLSRANLFAADLSEANLFDADLSEANLLDAVLQGARLWGADLSETRELNQKQIDWTLGNNEPLEGLTRNATKLPEGLNRPKFWSKDVFEQIKIVGRRELPQ
jgi:hypothetical protein